MDGRLGSADRAILCKITSESCFARVYGANESAWTNVLSHCTYFFGEAVNHIGFTDKEVAHLIDGKQIDSPEIFDNATNEDIATTLVHLSAIFHTWTANSEDVNAFVRTERFALPDEFEGQSATIAEAFLSRDLIKFEDAPKWVEERYLNWHSNRMKAAAKAAGGPVNGTLH